jgi:uncharacterized protein YdeI (YjbR/CyaY-like superfamily)
MDQTTLRKRPSASRPVNVPADLRQALRADAAAQTTFEALPTSHQREYVEWIEEARKEETRRNRIQKTLAMLVKKG